MIGRPAKAATADNNVTKESILEVRMSHTSQREAPASVPTHAAKSPDLKRRRFLLAIGAGSAGAAAAATQTLAAPVLNPAAIAAPDTGQGYRETEHVLDYYATTRI